MGTITVMLMLILFLLSLVFIFSTALLTPMIGKRNLLFVIGLGFIVGVIGGAFFISPIFDDIPNMARSVYQFTNNGEEVIQLDISANNNITSFIENTKKIPGVKDVQSSAITIKTDEMSPEWQQTFKSRIPSMNQNITSLQIPSNNTMILEIKNGTNPKDAINQISSWMMLVSGLNLRYSTVNVSVTTSASNVDSVIAKLPPDVVVTGVNGPVEDQVNSLKSALPKKSDVVLVCGVLGILTGIAGVFIDTILEVLGRAKKRIRGG